MMVQDPFMCLLTKIIIYIDGPCYMSVICGADPRFSYIRNAKSTTVPTVYRSRFSGLAIYTYCSEYISRGGNSHESNSLHGRNKF